MQKQGDTMAEVAYRPAHVKGEVRIPPSKSAAHRALLSAALCKTPCRVGPIDHSADMEATLNGVCAMGGTVKAEENGVLCIAPGKDKTATTRLEADEPQVLSGLFNGVTTGAPLAAIIANTNTRSKDYSDLKIHPRPGHADYTASVRYDGANDIRGGGHFSGRLTACLVFAGAVCRQILERRGITIGAHAYAVGSAKDTPFDPVNVSKDDLNALNTRFFAVNSPKAEEKMRAEIEAARLDADSIGGIIECAAVGVPAGIGSPMFGGIENVFASILYGIPAVKGVEFGAGFDVACMRGSENNDAFYYDENGLVRTKTNNAGGILGGITTGMPILFRIAVKPTPSIGREQHTVDLTTKTNAD